MKEFEDKSKLGYVITDKKISVLSSIGGEYMYGLKWDNIKYKWIEKKKDRLIGYHFFPKDKIDFGDHPILKSEFAQGMHAIWIPLPIRDSKEFVELIDKYSDSVEEKTREELEQLGVLEEPPQINTKKVIKFILVIGIIGLMLWGLKALDKITTDPDDKRFLSVEERKKIYSGEYDQ